MANYYGYAGYGGITAPTYGVNGTQLPTLPNSAGTVKVGEVTVAQIQAPDNREGPQAGVLLQGLVSFTGGTWGIGTIMARQIVSTGGGTSTATTGSILGTYLIGAGTSPASTTMQYPVSFIDNSGSVPLTGWNLTMSLASGTATVGAAVLTATPLGA